MDFGAHDPAGPLSLLEETSFGESVLTGAHADAMSLLRQRLHQQPAALGPGMLPALSACVSLPPGSGSTSWSAQTRADSAGLERIRAAYLRYQGPSWNPWYMSKAVDRELALMAWYNSRFIVPSYLSCWPVWMVSPHLLQPFTRPPDLFPTALKRSSIKHHVRMSDGLLPCQVATGWAAPPGDAELLNDLASMGMELNPTASPPAP